LASFALATPRAPCRARPLIRHSLRAGGEWHRGGVGATCAMRAVVRDGRAAGTVSLGCSKALPRGGPVSVITLTSPYEEGTGLNPQVASPRGTAYPGLLPFSLEQHRRQPGRSSPRTPGSARRPRSHTAPLHRSPLRALTAFAGGDAAAAERGPPPHGCAQLEQSRGARSTTARGIGEPRARTAWSCTRGAVQSMRAWRACHADAGSSSRTETSRVTEAGQPRQEPTGMGSAWAAFPQGHPPPAGHATRRVGYLLPELGHGRCSSRCGAMCEDVTLGSRSRAALQLA